MNVSFEKTDDLNAIITVAVTKEDYEESLNQQLKDYRKKANIPGFRKGQVPLGMVKSMVGKSILYEQVNKLTSNSLYDYLKENNIDILGQPMTSKVKESDIDFDKYGDFTFHFDLGLAPEFELNLSPKSKLERYVIELDDKEIETEIKNIRRQHGDLSSVDKVETDNDSIVLILTETDKKGEPVEDGVLDQETTVLPEIVKDKKVKKQLLETKVGDSYTLNIFKLFNDNDMVIAHSLGIEKEQVKDISKTFKAVAKEIRRVTPAEMNDEFYQKVFGADTVKTEEDFKKRIEENLGHYYVSEAEKQLESEINDLLSNKHKLQLPDEFLKRWLVESKPEEYTEDSIEERYAEESNILRKQLVREKIAEENKVEVTDEDLNQTSFAYTAQMLRQYGLNNPDPSMVQNFEAKNREDRNYMLRIRDAVVEKKVLDKVKELITVKEKKVTVEKFYDTLKKLNNNK